MDRALYFLIVLGTVCVILGTGIVSVLPHDWYPRECCSGQDCAPATVTQIETPYLASSLAEGNTLPSMMLVTTIHGSVIVPPNFKTRESPDGRPHACMMPSTSRPGEMRLICLFLPPSS